MQTKFLDAILQNAENTKEKYRIKALTPECVYLAMLMDYSNNERFASFDREEMAELNKTLIVSSLPKKEIVESFLENDNGETDQTWNVRFRIWLSMAQRNAVDALNYLASTKWSVIDKDVPDAPQMSDRSRQASTEAVPEESIDEEMTETAKETQDPSGLNMESLAQKCIHLREALLEKIVGQNHAIQKFSEGIYEGELSSAIDSEKKGPKAVFLFAGSPGVGKTFLATEAAQILGLETRKFDMTGYSNDGSAMDLTGADANFKSPSPGDLTGFVHDHPRSILIFDEIEKAHYKVINLFLQILDAGVLYDNKYEKDISFSQTILIFTTNAGKQLYSEAGKRDFSGVPKTVVLNALKKDINPATHEPFFPEALCSRMASGNVILFNRLSASDLMQISARVLMSMQENLLEQTKVDSKFCESMAPTILYSVGGNCDARTITGNSKRFFSSELYELYRLTMTEGESCRKLTSIRWTIDLDRESVPVRQLYEIPGDTCVLFMGTEKDREVICRNNPEINVLTASSIEDARRILHEQEVLFAIVDYLLNAEETNKYLNAEDVFSDGKQFFSEIRAHYPEMPILIWEGDQYRYSREEEVSFLGRGAYGILRASEVLEPRNDQLLTLQLQLHQQKTLDTLAAKHQVLTYETSQTINKTGTEGEIHVYGLHLGTAVEAEEQKAILSADEKPNVHWSDIVVSKDAKKELKYYQEYLKDPKSYFRKGAKAPKGILLYGPPGTGKTSLAKVMATESDVTFLTASADQFFSRWAGEGPQSVHQIFSIARKYAPAILFIDEIDAIGRRRTEEKVSDGSQEILNALLTEMDGFKTSAKKPVLVMAATNLGGDNRNTGALDPALVRRFDRSIRVDLPDMDERKALLRILAKKNPILKISDSMIHSIAERSAGMSPALIEGAVNTAIRDAIQDGELVSDEVLDEAFEKYTFGDERKWNKEELLRTARHEAGHAFISYYHGEEPSYLTIVSRGDHGGYMLHASDEGKSGYTKEELLNRIATALGGRAAELVFYAEGGLTTGASSDLEQASRIAVNMVCRYGMFDTLAVGLAAGNKEQGGLSDTALALVNRILEEQMAAAVDLLTKNREKIDALSDALMTKLHLNKEEIEKILK